MSDHDLSKRDFLKTVGYVAPVILTLTAIPSFAQAGSGNTRRSRRKLRKDKPGREQRHYERGVHDHQL